MTSWTESRNPIIKTEFTVYRGLCHVLMYKMNSIYSTSQKFGHTDGKCLVLYYNIHKEYQQIYRYRTFFTP